MKTIKLGSIRTFVAIRLPVEVRERLMRAQGELREILPTKSVAWTKPENMHLTVRFLGQIETVRLLEMTTKLRDALRGFGAVELVCEQLGCFPDLRFPRVVWARVHDAHERLALLYQQVNRAVEGFAEKAGEARFVGHVTLARPKAIRRPDATRLRRMVEAACTRHFGVWRCGGVELVQSELSQEGRRYTTLDEFIL